jgi:hypothetical protein
VGSHWLAASSCQTSPLTATRPRALQSRQGAQAGRLAAARGAEQGGNAAPGQLQLHIKAEVCTLQRQVCDDFRGGMGVRGV